MKCVQYVGELKNTSDVVKRVSDEEAVLLVGKGVWVYISKATYKRIRGGSK